MLTALLLTTQLLAQTDDAPAGSVETIPAQQAEEAPPPVAPAPVAAKPAPERGVSLAAGPTEFRKSTNPLIATLAIGGGLLGGYLGLLGGVLINFSKGGLSDPIDSDDALLLMVVPGVGAAAFAWIVGLLDLSQRTIAGSAVWGLLGAAIGEGAGLGIGYAIGKAKFSSDPGVQGLIFVGVAPAFAALGAVIFMELFKPGEEIGPSISVARGANGTLVYGPAIAGRF